MSDICKFGMENSVQYRLFAFSGSNLQLFRHHIAIRILHQFMIILPEHPANSFGVKAYV